MPEDIEQLKILVKEERGTLDGYDIAVGGSARSADWEQERTRSKALGDAGVTWWVEYIPAEAGGLETIRKLLEREPLRID